MGTNLKNLITRGFHYDESKFNQIKQDHPKPQGGLWACTKDGDEWNYQFCGGFDDKPGFTFDLINANILWIDDYFELLTIDEKYLDKDRDYLDFEKIAKDYDAMFISQYAIDLADDNPGPYAILDDPDFEDEYCAYLERGNIFIELPYWDIESIIVFNKNKIKNVKNFN